MTYFADLSLYRFHTFQQQLDTKLLNVGWLDSGAPFNKGRVDQEIVERLLGLCRNPVNLCRGYHSCQYCERHPGILTMQLNGQNVALGNGEIRVSGKDGVVYAAPTLICHYIQEHGYRPPDEFLFAVEKLFRS